MKLIATTLLIILMSCSGGHSIAGTWKGSVNIQGNDIPVIIYIKQLDDGKYEAKFDNPSQNVYGQKFDEVSYKDGELTLSSAQFDAIYAGTLSEDKMHFKGSLDFRGEYYTMNLKIQKEK